ncbi:MAG: BrnT family toxin [Nitrospirae bacterium]|nr:BrnT family toxin [Nitrospirota bacterium]MBI3605318.1 BrnT family toxin [Nitrospirota bacterium]
MPFEWDEEKCKKNIETHGIDFVDAAEIFSTPMLVILDDRKSYGESRYIGMGEIQGRIMVIIYTERKGDVIRIISLILQRIFYKYTLLSVIPACFKPESSDFACVFSSKHLDSR